MDPGEIVGLAEALFWLSLGTAVYVYAGYPLVLSLAAWLRGRQVRRGRCLPSVAVLIAAHNEELRIRRRLENLLSLDYPADRLVVIVGCDGCTDGTEVAARELADRRVSVVSFPQRRGKPAVLNRLLAHADSEVVLFADARQVFEPEAVRRLTRNFADPEVGGVTGSVVVSGQGTAAEGVGLYRRYDEYLRRKESELHSTLGAAGAIYALRRELCAPLAEDTILDDFVMPMRVVMRGYRVIYEPEARAHDIPPLGVGHEVQRKARTLAGNYQALWRLRSVLVPWRSRVWWQVASHKLGRLLVPFAMIGCAVGAGCAVTGNPAYWAAVFPQVVFYLWALAGWLCYRHDIRLRGVGLAFVFVAMNWAALLGFWRFIRRAQTPTWEKPQAQGVACQVGVHSREG
ncbi:MAG: glycosyltransferase family 2 protein [Armatimonadota bacterium]